MARVYLETSLVSALVTTRTDLVSLYRREASQEWWTTQAHFHELFTSAEVVRELSHPAFPASDAARDSIGHVPLLPITEEALGFAELLVREKVMPAPAKGDALHVAIATVHTMDFLLTWNVRHLANRNKVEHLRVIALRSGLLPPAIVTPELLWESEHE